MFCLEELEQSSINSFNFNILSSRVFPTAESVISSDMTTELELELGDEFFLIKLAAVFAVLVAGVFAGGPVMSVLRAVD